MLLKHRQIGLSTVTQVTEVKPFQKLFDKIFFLSLSNLPLIGIYFCMDGFCNRASERAPLAFNKRAVLELLSKRIFFEIDNDRS